MEEMILPIRESVRCGDFVFLSGIPPMEDGRVVAPGDVAEQAECVIRRMEAILAQHRMNLGNLAYVQVFLRTMDDVQSFNGVYARRIPRPYPARKVITTEFSSQGVRVEISAIAYSRVGPGKTKKVEGMRERDF
jgi:enamine deaminase RidA (YjgF/YER057c/UK114 family)